MSTATLSAQNLAVRFGKSRAVKAVTSLNEASRFWCAYRDDMQLGGSNSPKVTVIDLDSGKAVANISYNGRIWAPDGSEILTTE